MTILHADCRLIDGHRWRRTAVPTRLNLKARGAVWEVVHRCVACQAYRTRAFSILTGEIVGRTYVYPEGYTIPTGSTTKRNSPVALRRVYFQGRKSL